MKRILKLAVALLAVLPTSPCWAVDYLGNFPTSATVNYQFTTNGSTGAPIAPLSAFESADILIYKNNSATQRTSAAGITMTSPFDSLVGLHQLSISLSDNTDAGFWAAGNDYTVVLNPDSETVDGVSVAPTVLAQFSIDNRRETTAAEIRAAVGLATASLDTTLGTNATAVTAIKTKTDFLPSATAGATGGVLIAGSNAPTTFATLTSTGALNINGTGMVAQTGDSFTRLGVPATGSVSGDIGAVASAAANTLTQATNAASSSSAVQGKLPSGGANMAGEGATAKNLDQVEGGGTTQPRINRPPAERFTFNVSSRSDGTYKARGKLRLLPAEVSAGNISFGLRMNDLYGDVLVKSVGAATKSGLPALTITELGPHDTIAMSQVGGTASAGATGTITVPVTMETGGGGETVYVALDVEIGTP